MNLPTELTQAIKTIAKFFQPKEIELDPLRYVCSIHGEIGDRMRTVWCEDDSFNECYYCYKEFSEKAFGEVTKKPKRDARDRK